MSHHIVSVKTNLTVFFTLIFLTIITVIVSKFHLGHLNTFVAMLIASVKAVVVLLWFMHLKYDGLVNRIIFGSGFFFLLIFYILTSFDVFYR